MRYCPLCGAENRDSAQYCQSCSQQMDGEIICPTCKTKNPVTVSYCENCAEPLLRYTQSPVSTATKRLNEPESIAAGTLIESRYRIVKKLGKGGMGAVYLADDTRLNCRVALKEMSDEALPNEAEKQQAAAAFQQEARLLSMLSHAGLPRVTDYFSFGTKQYLVMDYLEGDTLASLLAERATPFTESQVLGWADQLCDVLSYLHSRIPPIIFRDIKPGNIMVLPDRRSVRLIDFGIARFFKSGASKDTVSLGTPGYAPPEQYGRGQTDVRSDVYALGATLHQMLTQRDPGDQPFAFPTVRSLNPAVSAQVDNAIMKAVSQKPEDRWQSVAEFRTALHTSTASVPTSSSVYSPATPQPSAAPAVSSSAAAIPPAQRVYPPPAGDTNPFNPLPAANPIYPPPAAPIRGWTESSYSPVIATLQRRLGGYLIDAGILGIFFIICALLSSDSSQVDILIYVWLIGSVLYDLLPHSIWGQSLGKRIVGIKVVKLDDSPVGFWRSLVRMLAFSVIPAVLTGVCFVGWVLYLMPLFDKKHRTFADTITKTKVIKV